ncbi:hypothetical protein AXE80_10880 [Wenyingzhuangia fucanilytica]|uniref:Uncharacterized protein n=1 Tax=Wenyingzhuangia fucanilytica TaxID=1790137 RepID=A0A1B1Y7N2_9FLAO|nr:M15 family metallopeptidase [Wenyingzhuangia fucanilytica]ANW96748.1 hypothetical protein AXE80_10880 [Wenyingzhuangia fucanilytica]
MAHDNITLQRIEKAHPKIREQLKADYLECNNNILGKGVRLRFSCVDRTPEEQNKLYAQGRTLPGDIVTWVKAWFSYHQYGLAFDIVLLYDNDGNGTFEEASWDLLKDGDGDKIADWEECISFFKAKGYETIPNDKPHFQKTFGYKCKELIRLKRDRDGYVIFK